MKTKDFERLIKGQGFYFVRSGDHEVWSNGALHIAIPHGKNINRMLARRLLKSIGYPSSIPQLNYFK